MFEKRNIYLTLFKTKNVCTKCLVSIGDPSPSVYLGRHCHHSHDKMDQAFPSVFPYCKQLKTGRWTVDGGKAREGGYFICISK